MSKFKKKLVTILVNPRIEASRPLALADCYKIKLRNSGYRLVYQVIDQEIVAFMVIVDKRQREQVYMKAAERFGSRVGFRIGGRGGSEVKMRQLLPNQTRTKKAIYQ